MKSDDETIRASAEEAIINLGEASVDYLIRILNEPDYTLRGIIKTHGRAWTILRKIQKPSVIPILQLLRKKEFKDKATARCLPDIYIYLKFLPIYCPELPNNCSIRSN